MWNILQGHGLPRLCLLGRSKASLYWEEVMESTLVNEGIQLEMGCTEELVFIFL